MQQRDVRSFDWDDSELRRAYAIAWDEKNAKLRKEKRRKWKVGDFCRARYSGDNLYYEAKITTLNGDFCTVEFLGYGGNEDVDLLMLKESEGKQAQKLQIRMSADSSVDDYYSMGETGYTTDLTVESDHSCKNNRRRVRKQENNATLDATRYEATFHQQYSVPPAAARTPPSSMPANSFMPPPVPMPQFAALPALPNMPQCPSLANGPEMYAMLTAWYMAGYYTGMHGAKNENQGSHHCCRRSNRCCRN